jgi:hypothetical protein
MDIPEEIESGIFCYLPFGTSNKLGSPSFNTGGIFRRIYSDSMEIKKMVVIESN